MHCLYLLLRIHTFVANSNNSQKSSRKTCWCLRDHCIHVSGWYHPVWTESTNLHYRVWDALISLHTFDDRSSRRMTAQIEAVDGLLQSTLWSHLDCRMPHWRQKWNLEAPHLTGINWNYIAIIGKCKIIDFFNRCQ